MRLLRELYVLYQASGVAAATTATTTATTGRSSSPRSARASSGRCWTKPRRPACSWCTRASAARLAGYEEAEFCLDVTRGEAGGLRIVPVIRADDGQPVVPVAFIGAEGHGAVYVDRAQAAGGDPGSWRVPAGQAGPDGSRRRCSGWRWAASRWRYPPPGDRFRDRYYPRLRQAAAVISSDGSFTPPVICGPDLVCAPATAAAMSWK